MEGHTSKDTWAAQIVFDGLRFKNKRNKVGFVGKWRWIWDESREV